MLPLSPDKTPVQVEGGLEALLSLVPLSTLGDWAGVSVNSPRWAEGQEGRAPIVCGWDSGGFAGYCNS